MTSGMLPDGIRAAGRSLWISITGEFDLDAQASSLLLQAARTADLLDDLEAEILAQGALVDSPQGRKANPAVVEARQQRVTLSRLLADLRQLLPGDETANSGVRPPRGGSRGPYKIRSVS